MPSCLEEISFLALDPPFGRSTVLLFIYSTALLRVVSIISIIIENVLLLIQYIRFAIAGCG